MTREGVGTIIGRKSVSKGREYSRVWIYIPTKLAEDTAFPFKIGDPCLVEIDTKERRLQIKPVSEKEAIERGWLKRRRRITK